MSITVGTFGYSFFDAFSNSVFGKLFVIYIDASMSDALLPSSPLAAFGVRVLAVTLTFAVLVEVWGRNSSRFTRPTLGVCGAGITNAAGCSNVRLPLGFAAGDSLGAAFAGAFRVGSFPFEVAFVFSGGCSPSLEVGDVLPLELVGGATIYFLF